MRKAKRQSTLHTSASPPCLLQLLERLYGITMKPAEPRPPTWHPDVLVFSLSNVGSTKPIAYIYAGETAACMRLHACLTAAGG